MTDCRVGALERAGRVYQVTQRTATGNAWAQGLSAIAGYGINWLVDVAAIPFYASMGSEIRGIYGKGEVTAQAVFAYIKPNLPFLAADLVLDKGLGSIPIVGIPFNMSFATAFAWRLGTFFGMISALGEETSDAILIRASMQLTSQLFPTEHLMHMGRLFKAPDRGRFIQLIASMDGLTAAEMQQRVDNAMEALKG